MLESLFHLLSHELERGVDIRRQILISPPLDRITNEGPLDQAPTAVDWDYFEGGHIGVEPHVVVENLIAEAVVDGIDGEKLLFDPIDCGLVRVVRRWCCGGAVANEAGLTFDALHLIASIKTGHPLVEAAKIL